MDKIVKMKTSALLLDRYDDKANMLRESVRAAGFMGPVLSLSDDAFLPDDVMSIYHYFIRHDLQNFPGGKARYFNQVDIPEFWYIKGDNSGAKIYDMDKVRGEIFYADFNPAQRRLVKRVDWFSENGVKQYSDYYDKYGVLYGRMICDAQGNDNQMSWFDLNGREIIIENKVTNDIILNRQGKTYIFHRKTDFVIYLLKIVEEFTNIEFTDIWYNSLSHPFFVSVEWQGERENGDVLFWQEGPRQSIPGNMRIILEGNTKTSRILVQNRESYEGLIHAKASTEYVKPLGFIYNYQKKNTAGSDVLICTNSDQIEHIDDIAKKYTDKHFHICAVTEMSQKLLDIGKLDNVSLYPSVSMAMVQELFNKCDYYLDINYGGQILDAVKTAYLYEQLIIGIEITVHNRQYIAPDHIFVNWKDMCAFLDQVFVKGDLKDELCAQKNKAMDESVKTYKKILFYS
ncbi:MAG: accessory Sec system glycosylation chaperone GtfB [Lachnospiraceae bacterium]|nr:accessory Sec system glycosylation chaperone GtfB [Lachnospiraceae bacterium]